MDRDHGIPVDTSRRCAVRSAHGKQCKNFPLEGSETCFVHTSRDDARVRAWWEKDAKGVLVLARANKLDEEDRKRATLKKLDSIKRKAERLAQIDEKTKVGKRLTKKDRTMLGLKTN